MARSEEKPVNNEYVWQKCLGKIMASTSFSCQIEMSVDFPDRCEVVDLFQPTFQLAQHVVKAFQEESKDGLRSKCLHLEPIETIVPCLAISPFFDYLRPAESPPHNRQSTVFTVR